MEPALKLEVNNELAVDKKAMTYAEVIKALPVIKTPEEYLYVGQLLAARAGSFERN